VSGIEIVAVALGLANIILLVRRSIWNYPFGIAMVSLYAIIFYQARLYSDALLQLFFILVQAWGWAAWLQGRDAGGQLIVRHRAGVQLAGEGALALMAIGVWGWLMHRFTDAAAPFWDAAVAMLSVWAQVLLARRYIENWPIWVLVNIFAIGLYASRDLWLTSGLYSLFLMFALWGWREWWLAGRACPRAE
jgi:nicotinamide mononucleotide transporter